MIPEERTELAEARIEGLPIDVHGDITGHQLHVGHLDSSSDMGLIAKNRIAHVAEMRDFGLIEKEAVLEFTGITDDAAIPNDNVFPKIGIVADFTIAPND